MALSGADLGRDGRGLAAALLLALAACGASGNEAPVAPEVARSRAAGAAGVIDAAHPRMSVPVADTASPGGAGGRQFVIVEIGAVHNPRLAPLIFAVHFRSSQGRQTLLGTFSLYLPDNPDRFLIATQESVEPDGEILLSLQEPAAEGMSEVSVRVSQVSLGPE